MASSSTPQLTSNGVPFLLKNLTSTEPLVVGVADVHPVRHKDGPVYCACKLFDGTHSTKALLLVKNSCNHVWNKKMSATILIDGYISSAANHGISQPFLCIESYTILNTARKRPTNMGRNFQLKQYRIQDGKASTFMVQHAPLLSNIDLAGGSAVFGGAKFHKVTTVQINDFLAHHAAMLTLHHSSSSNSSSSSLPTRNYMSALNEFASSQLDRQTASLNSNTGRGDANRATLVKEQYILTLRTVLQHAETQQDLTRHVLQEWHAQLCGNGVHAEAGIIRTKNVRAGTTSFCPKEAILLELGKLLGAVKLLEQRLVRNVPRQEKAIGTVAFAAAIFFGIVDIHPFSDGNGRLSRIVANWALRRGGLPFCINFFATQTQRASYLSGIKSTRRNAYLECHGSYQQDALRQAVANAGALLPLVDLVFDRVSKASIELNKVVTEKSNLATEEAEAKAARRFRECAAEGTCIICFDDRPNIATLCCGKAVHLNCIAEWLSSNNSCPTCRAELPTLPARRIVQSGNEDSTGDYDSEDESSSDDQSTSESEDNNDMESVEEVDAESTVSETSDEIETSDDGSTQVVILGAPHDEDESTTSENESTTEAEFACALAETTLSDRSNDGTSDDSTTSNEANDATTDAATLNAQLVCTHTNCRNRAASDCSNTCCGHCCVLHGYYACQRHNASH